MTGKPSSGYPGPIAGLPPGFFWTRSAMIGMTPEEQRATDRGEQLPEKRVAEITFRLEIARMALVRAEVVASRV